VSSHLPSLPVVVQSIWLRLSVVAVALCVAAFAALLAQDVRAWHDMFQRDSARYLVSSAARQELTASTVLPSSVSGRVLQVGQDQRWFTALRDYRLARAIDISTYIGVTPKQERFFQSTESELAQLAQDPNAELASRAYELLGIVLFLDARASVSPPLATFAASISAAQNAVRADPSNESAKVDLELLLSQQAAEQSQNRSQRQSGNPNSHSGQKARRGEGNPPPSGQIGDY
jgi:hypothetical protein